MGKKLAEELKAGQKEFARIGEGLKQPLINNVKATVGMPKVPKLPKKK